MGPLEGGAAALDARRGFTLVELAVVICLFAVFIAIALDRLLRYQELGEHAALEQNLAAINTALTMRFATLVIAGRAAEIEKEVGANPVHLLARPPENYLGALYSPEPDSLQSRSWYFDRASGDLVYMPGRRRYLTEPPDAANGLRFRVELAGSVDAELRQPVIRPLKPYRWILE